MKKHLLVFMLDGKNYAVRLNAVERIVAAAEITPLPEGPAIVTGVINVRGRVVPVVNLRRRFRLPERDLDPADSLVLVNGARWTAAFAVDSVKGVIERGEEEVIPAGDILPGTAHLEGMVKLDDELVFLHDMDKALSLEEQDLLAAASQPALPQRPGEASGI